MLAIIRLLLFKFEVFSNGFCNIKFIFMCYFIFSFELAIAAETQKYAMVYKREEHLNRKRV